MSIQMIGVDHTRASIDVRTVFSFTKKNIAKAMEAWRQKPGLHGCVIISTCNRMELWGSMEEGAQIDLYEMLAKEKGVCKEAYAQYVIKREGKDAVEHLFELSCGLQSRILGEDQIITQVKDALAIARENYATDNVLEVLFRMAVTAAKKVKTEVVLSDSHSSAIHRAAQVLKEEGYSFAGKKCMVIGNGEMGKLSAAVFEKEGADVTVTVRQYRSGIVDIPRGCRRIDYGERMSLLPECDYVISATASPNYTITQESVRAANLTKPVVMIDLAVPRDIEVSVGSIDGVTLYDIDYFEADHQSEQLKENMEKAKVILRGQMKEFFDWYEGRDLIEKAQIVKACAVEDFHLRTRKQVKELSKLQGMEKAKEDGRIEEFQDYIEAAAGKVVNKMIFGLRGNVSEKTFRECVEALEKIFERSE